MKLKRIHLVYTEEDFNKIKSKKEAREKELNKSIKWEDFVIVEVLRR